MAGNDAGANTAVEGGRQNEAIDGEHPGNMKRELCLLIWSAEMCECVRPRVRSKRQAILWDLILKKEAILVL